MNQDNHFPAYEKKTVLITVKTYPTPAAKGAEVSCTVGITYEQKWIRLFPIPFRFMGGDKQFKKYQWVEVFVKKSSDKRKESFEVDIDTLNVISEPLSTQKSWEARKQLILPLKAPSLCYLQRNRKRTGDTLSIIKPKKVHGFSIEADTPDWTPEQKAKLLQYSLFDKNPLVPLEKIPYKFSYRFSCDDSNCNGHKLMCTDWELGASYWKWKRQYGDEWYQKIINKYDTDMIFKRDIHFFVGTVHGYPRSWIIIGLFYPPK